MPSTFPVERKKMPKSKNEKQVITSKTKPKDKDHRENLIETMTQAIMDAPRVFVLHYERQNNEGLKELRIYLGSQSRLFLSQNSAEEAALAELGKRGEELGKLIKNHSALLATTLELDKLEDILLKAEEVAFAEAGETVTQEIVIPAGFLNSDFFPGSLEPYLRSLGVPTSLQNEKIYVLADYVVCKAGDVITNAEARILKEFGYELSEFKVEAVGYYSKEDKDFFLLKDELASWLD